MNDQTQTQAQGQATSPADVINAMLNALGAQPRAQTEQPKQKPNTEVRVKAGHEVEIANIETVGQLIGFGGKIVRITNNPSPNIPLANLSRIAGDLSVNLLLIDPEGVNLEEVRTSLADALISVGVLASLFGIDDAELLDSVTNNVRLTIGDAIAVETNKVLERAYS